MESGWGLRKTHLTHWRLGGVSNREIDFGFGCGAVRACVRAKLCAGVKGTMVPPGARPKNWKFVCFPARPCPAPRLTGKTSKKKVNFFHI